MRAGGPIRGRRARGALAAAAAPLVAAVLGGSGLSSCGSGDGRLPDVIVITVDTLRADHLSPYGYGRDTTPNLARRFRDGSVYLRAYSTESSTSPSVVSMLTGRLPQDHRVRMLYQLMPDEIDLVTNHLPREYQKAAFVSNIVLTDEALGIAHRFDHYDDLVDEREPRRQIYERNARRTSDAVLAWLDQGYDPRRPLFLWVHYIDPHGPYQPPSDSTFSFQSEQPAPINNLKVPNYTRVDGISDGNFYVDRYDEEIAYADAQIERVLAAYAQRRPFEDTLVVFTADHGESMMEHSKWFTHSYHVHDELVRVPLLLTGPGVPRARPDALASCIDVAPTILRFLGVEVPPTMPGFDLRRPAAIPAERIVYSEAGQLKHQWRTAIRGDDKWVVLVEGGTRKPVHGYYHDLAADPGELVPRPWRIKPPPVELLKLVQDDPDPGGIPLDAKAGIQIDAPKVDGRNVSPQAMAHLRALGYVGTDEDEADAEVTLEETFPVDLEGDDPEPGDE